MPELATPSSELTQEEAKIDIDIQSLIGGIDISSFKDDLSSILSNQHSKELLIKELKENQPITGKLLLRRIISGISEIQKTEEKTKVTEKDTQITEKDTQITENEIITEKENNTFLEEARIATSAVSEVFSTIDASIPEGKKTEISSKISSELGAIASGNIPNDTKNFLDKIGAKTPESIASPEVQSILKAHISTRVYLENKDSILASNPELKGAFDTLDVNKFALGLQSSIESRSSKEIIQDIPKKTRESVVDTINILNKDKPENIVTRNGNTLTFIDPRNERYSYEIDMSEQPPRLAKSLNGLSISRDIKNASPEEQAKKDKYETTQKQLQKTSEIYNTATTQFWGIRRDEYTLTGANGENIYSSVFLSENRDTQRRYEELEGRLASNETPRDEKGTIIDNMLSLSEEMKSNNLSKLLDTGETENHGKIDKMIEGRREQLRILKSTLQDFSEAEKSAKDTPKPQPTSDDTFDEDASVSLNFLVENGLHHLGQQGFEELMNAWNRQHLESKNYQINLQDSPRIGTLQKKEFGDFIRKRYGTSEGARNASLTQERKNLTNNDFRTKYWNNIGDRQAYLFDTKSENAIPPNNINNSAENTTVGVDNLTSFT